MAFRSTAKRKEIKKSSYYLWFLGAKESHGLRGDAYIRPGLRYLIEREREIEPIKVTLQVSTKGLKIVQNVSSSGPRSSGMRNGILPSGKGEVVKHFIPHDAITCVIQGEPPEDDLVACILLLFNPVTRCPIHVHAYRCDSVETATVLRRQLQTLTEHPDTQKKMAELEDRLQGRGYDRHQYGRLTGTSDGRSRGDSESSGSEREIAIPQLNAQNQPLDERTAHLYASLAAELREKLKGGKSQVPILLPPRDYDTMHRNRGKLDGIDTRKSLQASVVGPNGIFSRRMRPTDHPNDDSSGKSSGIGSDEAPSSPPKGRRSSKDRDVDASSSEDEWEMQRQLHAKAARELLHWEPPTEAPTKESSTRAKLAAHVDSRSESRSRSQSNEWRQPPRPCRVLPRISPKSPPRINVYHELPEEKRYPGLDRESARMHYSEHGSDRRMISHQRFSYTEPNGYNKERRRISSAREY